jgi:putative phosphoesterase
MDVGLISDVHGNLPALEAVLEDMPDVDRLLCAGDVVGYNPWPAACVDRVREVADGTVVGNHDRHVHAPEAYGANQMAKAGLEYAKDQLSTAQLEWLADRPRKLWFPDDEFLLVHDHPEIEDKYVRPAEFHNLPRYLDDERGVVLGHTHIQHAETAAGRLLVNPGSVGQPRDGDPDAAYAVLDVDAWEVDLRRVSYDVDTVISKVEETALPNRIGTRLLDGS